MATDSTNILVQAGVVSVGAYVTAGGAGSLTDVGHVKNPIELQSSYEDYEVVSERVAGVLDKYPTMARHKIKIPCTEAILERWRWATRQPAANVTGTPPDETLAIGEPSQEYFQVEIVGKGVGTTAVRTITAWKCIVESVSAVQFAKGAEQLLELTLDCLLDESVATLDKFMEMAET